MAKKANTAAATPTPEPERKIDALTGGSEPDERSEVKMLIEKLGQFANTPLGKTVISKLDGGNG